VFSEALNATSVLSVVRDRRIREVWGRSVYFPEGAALQAASKMGAVYADWCYVHGKMHGVAGFLGLKLKAEAVLEMAALDD